MSRGCFAYLHRHSVSLYLTTPFLSCNGLVPGLVVVEVESHERRGVRRDWRRNDATWAAMCLVREAKLRIQNTPRAVRCLQGCASAKVTAGARVAHRVPKASFDGVLWPPLTALCRETIEKTLRGSVLLRLKSPLLYQLS